MKAINNREIVREKEIGVDICTLYILYIYTRMYAHVYICIY